MTANSQPQSAKIYQFPRKTSASLAGAGREIKSALDHRQRVVPTVEFGSGWYHEAAMQAERTRKI
ncbi:DUF2735 domain-containing protein [Methylocapsa sp. S129]|uniref:DUF2735 domain-containing protein n=1 Tax=Methylocapsa sp. S129 TaxID=1641869 RepID=UPI00131B4FF0|nr:DUF2735 domain-containing protein [Methylocapsa sp. S129]